MTHAFPTRRSSDLSATSWPSRWPRTRIKPIAPGWTWLDLDVTRFRRGIAQANARRLRLVGYRHTHPQGVARLPGAAIAGFGYLRQGAAIARLPSSRANAIIDRKSTRLNSSH